MANELPKRKNNRLTDFDYSQAGYYFVTVCTKDRACIFGGPIRAGLGPAPTNALGQIVRSVWDELPNHTCRIRPDKFIVMPNHVHGILVVEADDAEIMRRGGSQTRPQATPIPEVIRQFKSFSAREINRYRNTPGATVWQRGYYDHVIRNKEDHQRI